MKESIKKIKMMNPSDLIPYNKNARIHDVDKIANSIREFGFHQNVLIFCKGDWKKASYRLGDVEVMEFENE